MLRYFADKLLRSKLADLEAELQARDRVIAVQAAELESMAAVIARDRARVQAEAAGFVRSRAESEGTHGK